MNEQQKSLVLSTVPILRQSGVALTSHFYQRMFTYNPELKHIFNQANQAQGAQQQALAAAVLAYAENINDPSVLLPVVERIAHKHTSLGIRAEQYAIVGKHLLASIKEVLGDAASDELVEAWGAAYQQLADLFIDVESQLYQTSVSSDAGWSGWRPFKVVNKIEESSEITSFYLEPNDHGVLPDFKPGQYVSVRLYVRETGYFQPRQYSLSQAAGEASLRISVKKETGLSDRPDGIVSSLLHSNINPGDLIELSAPFGEFLLQEDTERPIILISGGVGITPMMAITHHLSKMNELSSVQFIHSARNPQVHAFKQITDEYAHQGMKVSYFYDEGASEENEAQAGPFKLADFISEDPNNADYYICGPAGFMRYYLNELKHLGIEKKRIYAEAFGTGGLE